MNNTARIRSLIEPEILSLTEIRRDLHKHPQVAFEEEFASAVIQRELSKAGVDFVAGRARGTGVVGYLPSTDPSAGDRPAVALRADMDALPIDEQTGLEYASEHDGVMHACGHDGHTAILLGAARVLAKMDHRPNPIVFVFQPAEEGGGGGKVICEEGALSGDIIGKRAGAIFGLHGWPELTVGHVATRPGALLAAVDTFHVRVRGVGGHAAYPHNSVDPVIAAAHCVTTLQSIVARNVEPVREAVISVTGMQGGRIENVIPEEIEFFGTVRTHDEHVRELARDRFHKIVQNVTTAMGCHAEIDWERGYPVTYNDPSLTTWFDDICLNTIGSHRVSRVPDPHMGGEDFAYYGAYAPAVFFFLGLRPADRAQMPLLHQPDFDFNDDAIATGVEMFCTLALDPDVPLVDPEEERGAGRKPIRA